MLVTVGFALLQSDVNVFICLNKQNDMIVFEVADRIMIQYILSEKDKCWNSDKLEAIDEEDYFRGREIKDSDFIEEDSNTEFFRLGETVRMLSFCVFLTFYTITMLMEICIRRCTNLIRNANTLYALL